MAATKEFTWSETDEPHASRRKEMLAKYPQIAELFGHDSNTKWICLALVLTQIATAYQLRNAEWWSVVVVAFCFGGFWNHALNLGIHEISHNLLFAGMRANQLFGVFCNLPIGLATVFTFKYYHMLHHTHQGEDQVDVDIPTETEGALFVNALTKIVWVFLQPFFYALRPMFVSPKPVKPDEVMNWVVQLTFNVMVAYFWGPKSLLYFLASTALGLGLHPMAGHFISEHYVFAKGYETYSYYGPLNVFAFNVGYHNEHHDFPRIPGSRLYRLREIAPEYYESLPQHFSWSLVIWNYIFDPSMGPFARIKRHASQSASKSE